MYVTIYESIENILAIFLDQIVYVAKYATASICQFEVHDRQIVRILKKSRAYHILVSLRGEGTYELGGRLQ